MKDFQKIVCWLTESKPKISLLELWNKYYEYELPRWKESTQVYLQVTIGRWIEKANRQVDSIDKAIELRNFLLSQTTESMTKRVLTYVNAAYKWGLKQKLVVGHNPYDGMANELKHNYQRSVTPLAFTPAEKLKILENFANHKRHLQNKNSCKIVVANYIHCGQ